MPIDYKKYPKNWLTEIRPRILHRANNRCECCGFANYEHVFSFKVDGKTVWSTIVNKEGYDKKHGIKMVMVVLTIAHLNHDETNKDVKDYDLQAMCQLCHLRYDAEEKKKRRLNNKN